MINKVEKKLILMILLLVGHSIFSQSKFENSEYAEASQFIPEKGKAPGMKSRLVQETSESAIYVLTFSTGDEILSGLVDFALRNNLKAGTLSAAGATKEAILAWYNIDLKKYKIIPRLEPSEVVSLTGNLTYDLDKKSPVWHLHISLASSDGLIKGGHLVQAIVGPGLEIIVTAYKKPIYRKMNMITDVN